MYNKLNLKIMVTDILKKTEIGFEWVCSCECDYSKKFLRTLGKGYYIVRYGAFTERYFLVKEKSIQELKNEFWVSWKNKLPIFRGKYTQCLKFKGQMEYGKDYIITDTPIIEHF